LLTAEELQYVNGLAVASEEDEALNETLLDGDCSGRHDGVGKGEHALQYFPHTRPQQGMPRHNLRH